MQALKIEKNIPIPTRNMRPAVLVPTILSMEVGDSMVISKGSRKYLNDPAVKSAGVKFTARQIAANSKQVRVWRIA